MPSASPNDVSPTSARATSAPAGSKTVARSDAGRMPSIATRVWTRTSARSSETSGVETNVARGSMRTSPPVQRKTSR